MSESKYRVEPKVPEQYGTIKYQVKHNDNVICTCDSVVDAETIAGTYNATTATQRVMWRMEYKANKDESRTEYEAGR